MAPPVSIASGLVEGPGSRGSGFRVEGLGLRVKGLGVPRLRDLGFQVCRFGFRDFEEA